MNNKDFYVTMLTRNICRVQIKTDTGYSILQLTLSPGVLASAPKKPAKFPNTQYSFPVYNVDTKKWINLIISSIHSCVVSPLINTKTPKVISPYAGVQQTPPVTSSVNLKLRAMYINYLQNNICEIVFQKSDGTIRNMKATLKTSVMEVLKLTPTGSGSTPEKDLDLVRVIDIEEKDWRSFRLSRLISLTISTTGLIYNYPPNNPTPGQLWYDPNAKVDWIWSKNGGWKPEDVTPPLPRRDVVTQVVDDGSGVNNWNIAAIKDQLRKSVCKIVFEKADRTMRTMTATTLSIVIDSYGLQPSGTGNLSTDIDLIRVVDVDKQEWRSFRFSKMVSCKPLYTTVPAKQPQPAPTIVKKTKLHRS